MELPAAIIAEDGPATARRWLLSRALMLTILVFLHESDPSGDVVYYSHSLHQMFHGAGLGNTLQEYPLPVFAVLLPQFLIGFGNQVAFVLLFALSMLLVDAAFTRVLWRADGDRRGDATNLWLWFVPAVGPLAYFRFDLVPAVLAGGAVLVAIRRPAMAGMLTALGAALKLWPAVMLPTFLIRRADRRQVLVGFLSTGVLIGVLALAIGGLKRTLSPLHWQAARGLQVESVAATPLMIGRMFRPNGVWHIRLSQYKAFEIFGAGRNFLITATTVLTVLGGLLLIALWWRAWKLSTPSAELFGWLFLATAMIVTITNKTLSPQYLLWLGGPVAALAVRKQADHAVRTFARVLLVTAVLTQLEYPIGYPSLLVTAVLTQLEYPIGYPSLLKTQWPMWLITLVLAARNGLLVWLTWYSVREVWRQTAQPD